MRNQQQTAPARSRLVKVRDACEYGSMARNTLYRLIKESRIEARWRGGVMLVDLDSIDAYYATLPRVGES